MKRSYEDILDLERPISKRHPPMPRSARAAQFAPFAALTGYDDSIKEAARAVDAKPELTEEEKLLLDKKLQALLPHLGSRPAVNVTFFKPDKLKDGGECVSATLHLKKIDPHERVLIFEEGAMPIERLLWLECDGAM